MIQSPQGAPETPRQTRPSDGYPPQLAPLRCSASRVPAEGARASDQSEILRYPVPFHLAPPSRFPDRVPVTDGINNVKRSSGCARRRWFWLCMPFVYQWGGAFLAIFA